MANVNWDDSSLKKGLDELEKAVDKAVDLGIMQICDEVLRLSSFEVPHDKGLLQGSGTHEPSGEHERTVGYNKVYAARLHEHPEYHFQKGRKGKYLIDPIMHNLKVLGNYMQDSMNRALS